jgi:hypothetical protein
VSTAALPRLVTSGVIAAEVGAPVERVRHVLATRPHIRPAALAGAVRLYRRRAIAQVRYELNLIDARRAESGGPDHAA